MLRIFILFSLLLALIPMAHLSAAELENANVSGPETAPVLTEHEPFSAQVIVRNPHDRAVRIEHLDASCACMHLEAAENFIFGVAGSTLFIFITLIARHNHDRLQRSE